MKTLIFIIFILFSISLSASTKMGQLITRSQERFASYGSVPILIFDRDEIGWEFAKANAYEDEKMQISVLMNYVWQKYGLRIERDDAVDMAPYLALMTSSASALPMIEFVSSVAKKKFCAVFPPSANSNSRLAHERMTGLNNVESLPGFNYDNLNKRLSYDVLEKYSLYHEIAHCLDDRFIMDHLAAPGGVYDIHLAEAFADSLALFFMASDGHFGIGKTRAIHRAIYSRVAGPYFIAHPEGGMGSESYTHGGVIYYLSDILNVATRWVFPMSIASIPTQIKRATKIVEKNALSPRSLNAIYNLMAYGKEEMLASYQEKASDWPEMFAQTYKDLLNYLKRTDRIMEKALLSQKIPVEEKGTLVPLNFEQLCQYFRDDNQSAFFEQIDFYRRNLQEISGGAKRATELDEIYQRIDLECSL